MANWSIMEEAVVPFEPGGYPEMERAVSAAAAEGAKRIVLDLDGQTEISIEGVRSLIELLRRSRALGADLVLSIDGPEVRATLERMALDRIFPIVARQTV
jgi:anti-anti-sigma regulatory factor